MSAFDLAKNPNALRAEAQHAHDLAEKVEPGPLRIRLNALADHMDDLADQIDDLPPAERADLMEMLSSLRPH